MTARRKHERLKPGPRPKPIGQRQSRRVALAFTEQEHEQLQRAAGHEPVARYIRRLVLRHLSRKG